jgi:hypothetical protein
MRYPHGLQELLPQELAGMYGGIIFSAVISFSLMVIDYFHVVSVAVFPDKTHPVLAVDPDRVLPRPVSAQLFELVARRDSELVQVIHDIYLLQLL